MFEEVPRERRGVARWLLAHSVGFGGFGLRPLAVGPFVLGGGVLLAAVGGSVAVAATVLTASAIGSDDVPPRPPHPVAAAVPTHAAPVRPQASRPASSTPAGKPSAGGGRSSAPAATGTAPAGRTATATRISTSSAGTAPGSTPAGPPASSVPAGTPAGGSAAPAPSSSGPLGNALIHLSGYDPATGRFSYQFAVTAPEGTGADGSGYQVSSPDTYTAVLAPAASIVSGGTICPPAGSACTPDQLIGAADTGFFAQAAIDVSGALRSIVEVGGQPATAALAPEPDTSASPARGSSGHPGGRTSTPAADRSRTRSS